MNPIYILQFGFPFYRTSDFSLDHLPFFPLRINWSWLYRMSSPFLSPSRRLTMNRVCLCDKFNRVQFPYHVSDWMPKIYYRLNQFLFPLRAHIQ